MDLRALLWPYALLTDRLIRSEPDDRLDCHRAILRDPEREWGRHSGASGEEAERARNALVVLDPRPERDLG